MSACESICGAKTTVAVADDHPLVRLGVKLSLARSGVFEVVAEASSGEEALVAAQTLKPGIWILDVDMPGPGIVKLTKRLRSLHRLAKIVVLTGSVEPRVVALINSLRPDGFLHKEEAPEDLLQALRVITSGEFWTSNRYRVNEQKTTTRLHFTPREKQLLAYLASARGNAEIAATLNLRPQTVINYVNEIYDKISVTGRVEAVIWAQENGWLQEA